MADIKWIKVAVDMFEDSKIEFIRSLPEGDAIIVTWIQMMAIAGKSNAGGYLMVTNGIPYTEQLLSTKLQRPPVIFQFALETLQRLNMINVEDGPYHITKWEKHQNIDGMEKLKSKGAIRQKEYRERQKEKTKFLLEDVTSDVTRHNGVTSRNDTDIELEVELEKEKEKKTTSGGVFSLYQNTIGPMNSTTAEMLEDDIKTYSEQWVCDAIKEAARQGKNKLSYVEGILKRWHTDGKSEPKKLSVVPDKKVDKELEQRKVEIARNKWIAEGKNPDEFEYRPASND